MSGREPRQVALETLYELEQNPAATLPPGRAGRLVQGVADHRVELDRELEDAAEGWSVARMAVVDRSILRLALYEIRHTQTPPAVAISEAVKLAQRYSTEKSGAVVNGLLGTLAGV